MINKTLSESSVKKITENNVYFWIKFKPKNKFEKFFKKDKFNVVLFARNFFCWFYLNIYTYDLEQWFILYNTLMFWSYSPSLLLRARAKLHLMKVYYLHAFAQ